MNKLITKIVGVALGLSLATGVGVAVATSSKDFEPVKASTAIPGTGHIIDYKNIITGSKYYIGATNGSGTDFLLSVSSSVSSSIAGTAVTDMDNATQFTFTGSGTNWKIQFSNGNYLTLKSSKDNGKVVVQETQATWTASNESSKIRLAANNTYSLQKNNSGTQFGSYANTQTDVWLLPVSSDPAISSVSITTGNPTASEVKAGGSSWKMAATVTTTPENDTTLSKNVTWSVTPNNAVTFSKVTSASGEEITVTATNSAQASVSIKATSVQTSSKFANSNTFSIVKSYSVNSNTIVTKDGSTTYDAEDEGNITVNFISTLTYTGEAGQYKVNLTSSPSSGITFNCDTTPFTSSSLGSEFSATFTKNGTYTITSTPTEDGSKASSVTVTIENIFRTGYLLINDAGSLRNGAKVMIVSGTDVAMSTTQNTNNRGKTSVTITDDAIAVPTEQSPIEILTLHLDTGGWHFEGKNNKYLALKSSNNYLTSEDNTSDETKFSISFNGNDAVIRPTYEGRTNRSIRYNSGSGGGIFACYADTQAAVKLYMLNEKVPYFSIDPTVANIGVDGEKTISLISHNGATGTVDWSVSDDETVEITPNGLSTKITGLKVGMNISVTATFTSGGFDPLACVVNVLNLPEYVNIGVTTFTKMGSEENPADYSGTYLITSGNKIFDGSASPFNNGAGNFITYSSSTIPDSLTAADYIKYSFNIEAVDLSEKIYTLRSASNYFVTFTKEGTSATGGMNSDLGIEYKVKIDEQTITGLKSDGTTSSGTNLVFSSSNPEAFRFLPNGGVAISLYKADGTRKVISDALKEFYRNNNSNLQCVDVSVTPEGHSIINWGALNTAYNALVSADDKSTLTNMTANSVETGGNYLEAFISRYDYCVAKLGYTDFMGRENAGTLSIAKAKNFIVLTESKNILLPIVLIISVISATSIGGYFLLRKKKEER